MSRAFAPAEQGEPENKTEREDFKALLRSLHDSKAGICDADTVSRNAR